MQAAIESNAPIPPIFLNAPSVSPESLFYLHAFTELSTCRNISLGMSGILFFEIPWTAIDRYIDRYNVEDIDLFVQIIRKIDNYWVCVSNESKGKTK